MKTIDVDAKRRIVCGFFSTCNVVDQSADVLLPGCYAKSIAKRGPHGTSTGKIKHLLHHDPTQIPGRIIHLEEKKINGHHGLYFETRMSNTQLGEETLQLYEEGVYDNHSIGFNYKVSETAICSPGSQLWDMLLQLVKNPNDMKQFDEVYVISELDVFEGSTVYLGCNPETPFVEIKQAQKSHKDMVKYLTANFKL